MKFGELYSILYESPDLYTFNKNTEDARLLKWLSFDAVCFIATDHNVFWEWGITHGDIIQNFNDLADHKKIESFKASNSDDPTLEEFIHFMDNMGGGRDSILRNVPGVIMGRLWSEAKVISFWNPITHFNPINIKTIIEFISKNKLGDPQSYTYEVQSLKFTYEQFLEIHTIKFTTSSKFDPHTIHTINPALKGKVMKQQGIKPKMPIPIHQKYQNME